MNDRSRADVFSTHSLSQPELVKFHFIMLTLISAADGY